MADQSEAKRLDELDEDWPICCKKCGYSLRGLGEEGRCPECGEEFDRRYRIWEQFGPEAIDLEGRPSSAPVSLARSVRGALLAVVFVVGSLVAVLLIGCVVSGGRIDPVVLVVTWILVDAVAIWGMKRIRAKRSSSDG